MGGLYTHESEQIEQARRNAQQLIDGQQAAAIDAVNMYEAVGPTAIDREQAFGWFLAARRLGMVSIARSHGYVEWYGVDYANLGMAEGLVEKIDDLTVLRGMESRVRHKRKLDRERIGAALELVALAQPTTIGDASIRMFSEMHDQMDDPGHKPLSSADTKREDLKAFVYDWHAFEQDKDFDYLED